jgi:hypothetical protein
VLPRLTVGDVVIRGHRLLKTRGTILRFDGEDDIGRSRVWVRWDHANTLPNPSLEVIDTLELAVPSDQTSSAPRVSY